MTASEANIRWEQRLDNYEKAVEQLRSAVQDVPCPSNLEKEGTIQRFEFTHELARQLMQDYLEYWTEYYRHHQFPLCRPRSV